MTLVLHFDLMPAQKNTKKNQAENLDQQKTER